VAEATHQTTDRFQPSRPTHVGREKYLADFWIIEAADFDVALKLATEVLGACNRKVEVRRNAAKPPASPTTSAGSSDGFDESDRSQPAQQKGLKDIREAVSDRVEVCVAG